MDQRCEQDAGWNIARNTVLRFELVQIVECLGQLGIPVMVLKGAVSLIVPMYPDPGIRQMLDLDILVGEEDFERAGQALETLGYRTPDPIEGNARTYLQKGSVTSVDLHRHPVIPPWADLIDLRAFWGHAEAISLGDRRILIPSPEDQLWLRLIHLCFHDQKVLHIFNDPETLSDVRAIVEYYGARLKWEDILDRARRTRYGDVIHIVSYAVLVHYGICVQDGFPRPGPAMSPRFGRCIDWVRAMEDIPKWLYYAANRFLLVLMVRGGWSERLRATYDVLLRRSVFREPSTFLLREYRLDGHRGVVWILRGMHAVKMVLFHGIIMCCHAFFVVRQAFGWR